MRARTALGVQAPVSSLTRSTPRPRPCCVPAALVADRVEVAGLHAALASRIGHAHARDRDGVRQDAYAWAGDDDLGKAVLCVADGLGTQPRSHVGAQASANAAAAELVRAATNPSMVVAAAMAAIDLARMGSGSRLRRCPPPSWLSRSTLAGSSCTPCVSATPPPTCSLAVTGSRCSIAPTPKPKPPPTSLRPSLPCGRRWSG